MSAAGKRGAIHRNGNITARAIAPTARVEPLMFPISTGREVAVT
jgi:hypothetical protein